MRTNDGTGQRGHYPPKHVWVRAGDRAAPGVVLDWRVTEGGRWEAYVVWGEDSESGPARAHLEWVGEESVRSLE